VSYVVPTTLATSAEYAAWAGAAGPSNIDAILRSCTTLVFDATKTAIYAVDANGLATDTVVKNALRDATCIQAQAWVSLGIDPAAGGAMQTAKTAKRKKIGTAEVEYTEIELKAVTIARADAYSSLVPEAATYLRTRGLITNAVRSA
jgi:hypothetical protein